MTHDRNVLVVTSDSLSEKMAGPAIRAFEIAKAVASVANVKLASTVHSTLSHDGLEIVDVSKVGLESLVEWADVLVFQGHLLSSHPWIKATDKIIVVDIYDPMHLEVLEQSRGRSFDDRVYISSATVGVLNDQILRADYMVCASEKQRDFWLGQMAGLGRINPATYDADTSLRGLIDVVPFGLPDAAPVQNKHAIKGAVAGIAATDKVILWGGGIYNWFDPITLIKAVEKLAERRPEVRLYFLGVKHPNPHVPTMQMAFDAKKLAEERGLLDRIVFFNEGWVPYDERADYLLDADVGVSTHLDHLETAFSFRTRILDYLWTSLPVVSTDGDTFAELIQKNSLGAVVPAGDVEALEAALELTLFDDEEHGRITARVAEFAELYKWDRVLQPLLDFCANGTRAADLNANVQIAAVAEIASLKARVADLETQTGGLHASASWRITAPLRAVTGAARRILK
ncbi:hypothetical protein GCM10007382_14510 [Salinibacterium xinjiangense]|uniref:Glycosyl transferases group 1 n=1 Tax=Salinibacterium xinjiangense TaxID=386302 RepID=A0A2C8Y6N0_9MICO|nr:glycosyltransferase [Salinibacterium xinjiangense]GGK95378.1 hypothetical protein GCM10007382_14510 [Salinibacterium xinjiangense]SOE45792.1 Glycosyl transferases group 1 [Salinibacterium xinjiangense]